MTFRCKKKETKAFKRYQMYKKCININNIVFLKSISKFKIKYLNINTTTKYSLHKLIIPKEVDIYKKFYSQKPS